MIAFAFFGGAGAVLGLAAGAAVGRRAPLLFALGAGLVFAFILYAYFSSPTSASGSACSDCSEYLGRWWEPALVLWSAVLNLAGWCAGVLAGIALRRVAVTRRMQST